MCAWSNIGEGRERTTGLGGQGRGALLLALLGGLLALGACRNEPADSPAPSGDENPQQEDTGNGASQGETGETGQEEQSREADPPPVDEHVNYPAVLLLHVEDEDGDPIEGAAVGPLSRPALTDENGNARVEGLAPGDYALAARAEGYGEQVRLLQVEEGQVSRLFFRLREQGEPVSFDAAEGVEVEDGELVLEVPADALVDLAGEPHEGTALLRLDSYPVEAESDDAYALMPGPLLGLDAGGEEVALGYYGSFTASITDEDGRPLQLAEGQELLVRRALPDELAEGLTEGDAVPMWTLDPSRGEWVEQPDVLATAVRGDDGRLYLEARLPHLSTWNFDSKGLQSCFSIEVYIQDDLAPLTDLCFYPEPEGMSGDPMRCGTLSTGDRVSDGHYRIDVIRYPYELALAAIDINGTVLDVAEASVDSSCSATIELHYDGIELPALYVEGRGDDGCPVEGVLVRASKDGQAYEAELTPEQGFALFGSLEAGSWDVQALDAEDGELLDEERVELGEDELKFVTFLLPDDYERVTPGGCSAPYCTGEDCDSALQVTVLDQDLSPVPDEWVSFYDPISRSYPTGEDGTLCLDIPGGAGREQMFYASGSWPASVTLPARASCEEGGYATRTLQVSTASISCPAGTARVESTSRLMGRYDPGYAADYRYDNPYDDSSMDSALLPSTDSTLILSASGDGRLVDYLGGEQVAYYDDAWSFRRLRQDPFGVETATDFVLRAELDGLLGLDLELDLLDGELVLGETELGGGGKALSLSTEYFTGGDIQEDYHATSGTLSVEELSSDRVLLDIDAEMESTDGSESFELQLRAWVPIYSKADTPFHFHYQLSHFLDGTYFRVLTSGEHEGQQYGPAGLYALDPDWPQGDIQYCVPTDGSPYMLVGEEREGALRPFTALYAYVDGGLRPYGNEDPASGDFYTLKARWFERDFIEQLYRANDLDPSDLDENAVILGVALDADFEPVYGFWEAVLLAADGSLLAESLNLTDGFTSCGHGCERSSIFFFPDVPPTSLDEPYTLVVYDQSVNELTHMRQLVAPVAGGVMVPHN